MCGDQVSMRPCTALLRALARGAARPARGTDTVPLAHTAGTIRPAVSRLRNTISWHTRVSILRDEYICANPSLTDIYIYIQLLKKVYSHFFLKIAPIFLGQIALNFQTNALSLHINP